MSLWLMNAGNTSTHFISFIPSEDAPHRMCAQPSGHGYETTSSMFSFVLRYHTCSRAFLILQMSLIQNTGTNVNNVQKLTVTNHSLQSL